MNPIKVALVRVFEMQAGISLEGLNHVGTM